MRTLPKHWHGEIHVHVHAPIIIQILLHLLPSLKTLSLPISHTCAIASPVVSWSDARVQPDTVVIKPRNTLVTHLAVLCTGWPISQDRDYNLHILCIYTYNTKILLVKAWKGVTRSRLTLWDHRGCSDGSRSLGDVSCGQTQLSWSHLQSSPTSCLSLRAPQDQWWMSRARLIRVLWITHQPP